MGVLGQGRPAVLPLEYDPAAWWRVLLVEHEAEAVIALEGNLKLGQFAQVSYRIDKPLRLSQRAANCPPLAPELIIRKAQTMAARGNSARPFTSLDTK